MMKKTLLALSVSALTACGGGGGNNAPTFSQATYQLSVAEDQAATLNVTGSDKNSDTLTFSIANAAANGSANINASTGAISYQPHTNFNGNDSFQITVSDGKDSSTATVDVIVTPVNDMPVVDVEEVLVSGGETKTGQITATDADDDTLSYSIEQAPLNGELIIDSATGAIEYTPTELVSIDDSFVIKVSDGQGGETTKALNIKSSLNTNADRAYYYYASEYSHLRKAEALIADLQDDINKALVVNNLAVGYAEAGLISQVERLVNDDTIVRDEQLARTMLDVADVYNQLDLIEPANEYRAQANALYSQYVATKGLVAFDSEDTEFYTQLAEGYSAIDNFELADEALDILDELLKSVISGTTAAQSTFFMYRDLVEEAINNWHASGSSVDKALALDMANKLYNYAQLLPSQTVSFGSNEGESYYAVRVVALNDAVTNYINLNELSQAKEPLLDIFALYGITSFDEDSPRDADEFYQVTRAEYDSGLASIVENIVTLYPEADLSPYYAGFPEGSFWVDFNIVQSDAEDAKLMANVRNSEDTSEALALIDAAKDDSDLRNHYTNLVAFNSKTPGAARILKQQGKYSEAAIFLDEAASLLATEAYITENLWLEIFVTGTSGCAMVVNEYLDIHRITGDDAYQVKAQSTLDTCAQIALTHYSEGVDGSDVTIEDAIEANSRMLAFGDQLDISEIQAPALEIINTNFAKIAADEYQDKIDNLRWLGQTLYLSKQFSQAQSYYDQAIAQLTLLEQNAISAEVGEATTDLFNDANSVTDYIDFIGAVKQTAGISDNYADQFATAKSNWVAVIETRLAELEDAADQQKLTYLPLYAEQYIALDMYAEALEIAENEVFGSVEKENIITSVAQAMSLENDFISSRAASVDTDNDGLANFYLEFADEAMIAESGIQLDEDSDNDGTEDTTDSFPLDPNKQ